MSTSESPDDRTTSESPDNRTFEVGELVWVHNGRPPHALRRATVVRFESERPDGNTYTVRLGLGGSLETERSEMHHLADVPPVVGCRHCDADPNAAKSQRG
jgi:hypothetical protein